MPDAAAHGHEQTAPGARLALTLLLGINLFNYIDRQVLSAVLPKIQLDATIFNPSDKWLQLKSGALTTAFMFSYMLLSPVFGRLGDRWKRWTIIGLAVSAWSIASGCSGFAVAYWMLLATRCLVGVGEAAYGPIAPAMISDIFPASKRGKVMALFYLAIPVGSALGFVIGGQVEAATGHWQYAFFFTFLGIIFGTFCFFMKEPPRKGIPTNTVSQSYWDVLKSLLKIRSFVLCCLGMTCTTFILGGVAASMPIYVFQREARFVLNQQTIEKMESEKNNVGQTLIDEKVIAKLKTIQINEEKTIKEMNAILKTVLTEEEITLFNMRIFEAATSPNSLSNATITKYLGGIVILTGLVATILGGIAGDWFRGRIRGAYFHVAGWSTILAWPFFLGFLFAPLPFGWVLLGIAVFLLFFNTGPANTILANVVTSGIRATAFAINILVIHALGDAISPTVIGFIESLSDFNTAFVIVSFTIPAGGILWVLGAKSLDADTERATSSEQATLSD